MASENVDILPVVLEKKIVGVLTYQHLISIYKTGIDEHAKMQKYISLNRQRLKILIQGQKLVSLIKPKKSN